MPWLRLGVTPVVLGVALVGAFMSLGGSSSTLGHSRLVLGTDFKITSALYSASDCATPALLYPNVSRCLTYSVTNNLKASITVTSITLALDTGYADPPTCPAKDNLDIGASHTTFSGPLTIDPGKTVSTPASAGLWIKLLDTSKDQKGCKSTTATPITFHFKNSGTATYTEVYGTGTALASSPPSPSMVGQSVTYTATVTATATSGQDPTPFSPTGTVTFKDGSATICTVTFANPGTAGATVSTATCSPPPYTSAGMHSISAAYADTQGNFNPSSAALTQTVQTNTANNLVSSLPGGSVYGQSVTFSDTLTPAPVPSGQTVTFYDGTTLIGTGTLNVSGVATLSTSTLTVGTHPIKATYAGNGIYLPSNSNTVSQVVNYTSCITGSQNGNYTVPAGQAVCVTSTGRINGGATVPSGSFLYLNGGTINGGVTVNAGGSFYMTGGTVNGSITLLSPGATFVMNGGTVNGNISSADAKMLQICGALNINGTVSASGTTSYVVIGDGAASSTCAANKITGAVTLTNNTSGLEVSLNTITGNVTLSGNTGGTATGETANEVEANKITGNLACNSNTAAPINDGKPNTVSGSRTGQCAGL